MENKLFSYSFIHELIYYLFIYSFLLAIILTKIEVGKLMSEC